MKLLNWRLYVVTPEISISSAKEKTIYKKMVEEAILGGADVIQFRPQGLPCTRTVQGLTDHKYYEVGKNLRSLTKKYNVPLIVNNRLDLALAIGADGLHLGQDDLPVVEVKKLISSRDSSLVPRPFVIGVSTHSLEQAIQAEKDGADYLSIGPIFSTPLKPEYKPLGVGIISEVKKKVKIPFFAIGGINQDNLKKVISAGAERIAVIRAVFSARDIRQATAELKKRLLKNLNNL